MRLVCDSIILLLYVMAASPHTVLPFDPRNLPIWQEATHILQQQPAIAAERLRASALRQRFSSNLSWQAEPRNEQFTPPAPIREAAVLIGLQPASPDPAQPLQVVLTQRGQHLNAHPGQIAFPGGKIEAHDADATAAALREAQEEIGLSPDQAQVLGTLLPYKTGTGYRVTPVVALLHPAAQLVADPQEVTEIFRVPLDFLMNPAHHRKHFWQPAHTQRREWFSMPYTDADSGQERFIWGVTAGILRDLYQFLAASA